MASDDIRVSSKNCRRLFFKDALQKISRQSKGIGELLNKNKSKAFSARVNLPKYKRELLGEITDPKESFLGTISDLAEFKAVDNYFGKIRLVRLHEMMGPKTIPKNPGIAKLFEVTSELSPGEVSFEREGFTVLDDGLKYEKAALDPSWLCVSPTIDEANETVIGDTNVLGSCKTRTPLFSELRVPHSLVKQFCLQ